MLRKILISIFITLPLLGVGYVAYAQVNCTATWCDPVGEPPANNASGPIWAVPMVIGEAAAQPNSILVSGSIVASVDTADTNSLGNISANSITDAVTGKTNTSGKAGIKGIALTQGAYGMIGLGLPKAGNVRTWAGYFGDGTTTAGDDDGSIFAEEFCLPKTGGGEDCVTSWTSGGPSGDLWKLIGSSKKDIQKNPADGLVVIGGTLTSSFPADTKVALAGDTNAPRLYLQKDPDSPATTNPEINFQLSNNQEAAQLNDHWSIYADSTGGTPSRQLRFWSKQSSADSTAQGNNTFTMRTDGVMEFAGLSGNLSPSVYTNPATLVSETSAKLNGSTIGGTEAWFMLSTSASFICDGKQGTRHSISGTITNNSFISATIFSLNNTTVYYYCAIASNAIGTSYGSVESFRTTVPRITTNDASNFGTTSATLNGSQTGASSYWFWWGKASEMVCNSSAPNKQAITGNFTYNLTGLQSGMTYAYCAAGSNASGTSVGSLVTFGLTTLTVELAGTGGGTVTGGVTGEAQTIDCGIKCNYGYKSGDSITIKAVGDSNSYFGGWSRLSGDGTCSGTNSACKFTIGQSTTYRATFERYVVTGAATDVGEGSATLNGSVNTQNVATNAWFRYCKAGTGCTSTTACSSLAAVTASSSVGGSGTVAFSKQLSSLLGTYYYCAVAQNSKGTFYGALQNFSAEPRLD